MSSANSTPPNTLPNQAKAGLRWRARRGLLENDILLTRFLDTYETTLTEDEIDAFEQLLALSDNDLMDLLLERIEPQELPEPFNTASINTPAFKTCLAKLRAI
jgi:antitoxin CptB